MESPEYFKCILKDTYENSKRSWCGRHNIHMEFYFFNIDHAALTRERKDRCLVCQECRAKVIELLNSED
jgi:hypothetical protein